MNEIERMWKDHESAVFPESARGEVIEGVDLVEVDTFAAGCIVSFLANKGVLDADRIKILRKCVSDLETVNTKLNGRTFGYFNRLCEIGRLVLIESSRR